MVGQLRRLLVLLILMLFGFSDQVIATANNSEAVELPEVVLSGMTKEISIHLEPPFPNPVYGEINGNPFYAEVENGIVAIPYHFNEKEIIHIEVGSKFYDVQVSPIPLWLSIIPPLVAIFLALVFREVITSLFIGLLSGSLIISCYSHGLIGIVYSLMDAVDKYILVALNNWGHLAVILFSTLIGGMVALVSKNGGMQGVVDQLSRYAKSDRSSQLITWLLGILIFFDDYANTLIVGNTMRPLTDKFKVSREKLSYIVDSTAAPIASIAFVTTWIGAELGYIQDGVNKLDGISESAYSIFINSLQFAFYPILTLFFVLLIIWKKKDFGPMLKAENASRLAVDQSAHAHQSVEMDSFVPDSRTPRKWYNAAIPVILLVLGTITGIIYTGWDMEIINSDSGFMAKLSGIVGNADSYLALMWSSALALIVAVILTVSQKIMKLHDAMESTMSGFKTMLNAVVILILAWSLALVTEKMETATFLTTLLSERITPELIPGFTFVLAALVAFSTGSSWGTMAILYPLMLPACWNLSLAGGLDPEVATTLFYNAVSAVLAGSVLGDHCSPISDTTILSSLASSCNHIDHVRTQLPYALTVGLVSLLIGIIPTGFGVHPILAMFVGAIILILIINYFGKEYEVKEKEEIISVP